MKRAAAMSLFVCFLACAARPDPGDAGLDAAVLPAGCPATTPDSRSSCAGVPEGTVCRYAAPDGTQGRCGCAGGQWACDTCDFVPSGYPQTLFSCATARANGCTLDTTEWQIRCYCLKPELAGICCGSEALDRYYNCLPERQREGAPCCASCAGTAVDGGTQSCSCGADHRFHCTTA